MQNKSMPVYANRLSGLALVTASAVSLLTMHFASQPTFAIVQVAESQANADTPSAPKESAKTLAELLARDKQSPESILQMGEIATRDAANVEQVVPTLLKQFKPGGDELVRQAAEISLRRIGAPAVPFLKQKFESSEWSDHVTACGGVKAIGEPAASLLPYLRAMLATEEPGPQRAALFALQGLGEHSLDVLEEITQCLSSHDFNVQCMACRVLEPLGVEAMSAEPALFDILQTGNPSSRGWAAIVLGAIGPTDDHDVVPALIGRLQESRAQMEKQRILIGLAYLGRDAQRAVPVVEEFLAKRHHHVKSHAAFALFRITGNEQALEQTLREALGDRNDERDAFEIINRLGAEALPLKADLVNKLNHDEEDIRELAVLALARLGDRASDAIPSIEKMLTDPDALIRQAAEEALAAINRSQTDEK